MWIVEGMKGDVSALDNLGELREGSVCDFENKGARGSIVVRAWVLLMGMIERLWGRALEQLVESDMAVEEVGLFWSMHVL